MCGRQASTGGMTSIVRLFSLQEVHHAWSCALVVCDFRSIHTSKQILHTHACSASGPDAHTTLRRRSPHRRRGRHRPPLCRFSLLRLQAAKNKHFPGIRVVGCFRTHYAQHCSLDSKGSRDPKELREDSTQTKKRVATNTRD